MPVSVHGRGAVEHDLHKSIKSGQIDRTPSSNPHPRTPKLKDTIRYGGSNALYAAYTVQLVYTVDTVYTVYTVYTIRTALLWLNISVLNICLYIVRKG